MPQSNAKARKPLCWLPKGFRDVLEFRREQRYDIYNLFMSLPEPVVPRELVYGIEERMDSAGQEVVPLDHRSLDAAIAQMREQQVRSVAVCYLHSYINGAHEQETRTRLESALPGVDITLSSVLVPEMREFERASTTTLNAYTLPLLREHTQNLRQELKALGFEDDFYMMLSSGGILSSELAREIPVKAIESGWRLVHWPRPITAPRWIGPTSCPSIWAGPRRRSVSSLADGRRSPIAIRN